jgi:hypothetical protein
LLTHRSQVDTNGVRVGLALSARGVFCADELYLQFRSDVAATVTAIAKPVIGQVQVSSVNIAHYTDLLQSVLLQQARCSD